MDFKPPLPTDNLYKFMALFGVTLIALSFFAYYQYHQQFLRLRELALIEEYKNKSFAKWKESRQKEVSEFQAFSNKLNRTKEEYEKNPVDYISEMQQILAQVQNQLDKMQEYRDRVEKENSDFLNDKSQLIIEAKVIADDLLYKKSLKQVSDVLATLGIVLIITGFSLWYYKLQLYQDRIIKKQAQI